VSWEAIATEHTAISKVNTAVNGNDKVDVKRFIIFLLLSNERVAMVYFFMGFYSSNIDFISSLFFYLSFSAFGAFQVFIFSNSIVQVSFWCRSRRCPRAGIQRARHVKRCDFQLDSWETSDYPLLVCSMASEIVKMEDGEVVG
jgi:hypothetical protein